MSFACIFCICLILGGLNIYHLGLTLIHMYLFITLLTTKSVRVPVALFHFLQAKLQICKKINLAYLPGYIFVMNIVLHQLCVYNIYMIYPHADYRDYLAEIIAVAGT